MNGNDTNATVAAATQAAVQAAMSAEKAAVQAAIVGVNIDNIKLNIREIKDTLKDMSAKYVLLTDFIDHIKVDDDHEQRIRQNTSDIQSVRTQLKTWGSVFVFLTMAIQLFFQFLK